MGVMRLVWGFGFGVGLATGIGLALSSAGRHASAGHASPEPGFVLLMAVLWGAGWWLRRAVLRDGYDGAPASDAERKAWRQMSVAFVIITLSGIWVLRIRETGLYECLAFAVIAALVLVFHLAARRHVERGRLRDWVETPNDERERAIRTHGEIIGRRTLDGLLVLMALLWVLVPDALSGLRSPLQVGAMLLLPIGLANLVGEGCIAWRHWRDRRA